MKKPASVVVAGALALGLCWVFMALYRQHQRYLAYERKWTPLGWQTQILPPSQRGHYKKILASTMVYFLDNVDRNHGEVLFADGEFGRTKGGELCQFDPGGCPAFKMTPDMPHYREWLSLEGDRTQQLRKQALLHASPTSAVRHNMQ